MATSLYIISNISTTKKDVLANKDRYLEKLKALNLDHTSNPTHNKNSNFIGYVEDKEDWEYELPTNYDPITDYNTPNEDSKETIYFESPFVFSVRVYETCLELSTIYKYRFLYEDEKTDYINEFRKNIYDIIPIFGGTEIIY